MRISIGCSSSRRPTLNRSHMKIWHSRCFLYDRAHRARGRTVMTEAITRILVPVDFSAHSEKAVRYATTVANRFGARVKLLHVVEDPFVTGAWSAEAFVPNIPELLDTLIKAAQEQLAVLKKRLAEHGFVVETAVVTGEPARTI